MNTLRHIYLCQAFYFQWHYELKECEVTWIPRKFSMSADVSQSV